MRQGGDSDCDGVADSDCTAWRYDAEGRQTAETYTPTCLEPPDRCIVRHCDPDNSVVLEETFDGTCAEERSCRVRVRDEEGRPLSVTDGCDGEPRPSARRGPTTRKGNEAVRGGGDRDCGGVPDKFCTFTRRDPEGRVATQGVNNDRDGVADNPRDACHNRTSCTMPLSHSSQITTIGEYIEQTAPNSLLDGGVGMEWYGFLPRQNLELLNPELVMP